MKKRECESKEMERLRRSFLHSLARKVKQATNILLKNDFLEAEDIQAIQILIDVYDGLAFPQQENEWFDHLMK